MTVLFLSFLIGELHFFYAHPKTREYELDELTLSFPDMSKAPFKVHINLYISCISFTHTPKRESTSWMN